MDDGKRRQGSDEGGGAAKAEEDSKSIPTWMSLEPVELCEGCLLTDGVPVSPVSPVSPVLVDTAALRHATPLNMLTRCHASGCYGRLERLFLALEYPISRGRAGGGWHASKMPVAQCMRLYYLYMGNTCLPRDASTGSQVSVQLAVQLELTASWAPGQSVSQSAQLASAGEQ